MKIQTLAGTRSTSGEPPRSTAYYYADLERFKKKTEQEVLETSANLESEYVETNEVINDGAVREVPPLRDRTYSLPESYHNTSRNVRDPENSRKTLESSRKFAESEFLARENFRKIPEPGLIFPENSRKNADVEYTTPENSRKFGETYSTAGTFPMPEPKEKEPLLAELEVVGRLPLSQLDPSVRRSRSWYLCCPNVEEEMSRESSWRYSSLRPVTVPPVPGQNGMNAMVASQSSGRDDVTTLRTERDALARALAAERQRSATAARAHDARLAELHGVIAELVRRRAHDKQARGIPEEEVSDECESTTQPAGELDNDADRSRTEQNDTSSLSPEDLPTPQGKVEVQPDLPDDTSVTTHELDRTSVPPTTEACDTSLDLSARRSVCHTADRCCTRQSVSGDSCERERGSPELKLYTNSSRCCSSRQAKLASRVRLKKTEDIPVSEPYSDDEWTSSSLDVCAHADLREALLQRQDGCVWMRRAMRVRAERDVLRCALARATDTAHRLYSSCAVQESSCVSLCMSLRCADAALETYDVLLALAETGHQHTHQRAEAELVAGQLLARLDAERGSAAIGDPLLPKGPWVQHNTHDSTEAWSPECEVRLRSHAARLKADTISLREIQPPPAMFSYHDIDETEVLGGSSSAEMEAAVTLHDALSRSHTRNKTSSCGRRKPRPRHWLDTPASETDL